MGIKMCQPLIVGATFLASSIVLGLAAHGQGVPTTPGRQVPAPWRPVLNKPQSPQSTIIRTRSNQSPVAQTAANVDQGRSSNNRLPDQSPTAPGDVSNGSGFQSAQLTRVTKNLDSLPNSAGQVWREYDIRPYTSQINSVEKPQQAILDWVLQETGTEMWFNDPVGLLNADRNRLLVYHTPEIQSVVKSIVDRFVKTRGQVQTIDINLVTIENPNWRAQSYSLLQPVSVNSPGVEAWMISKENAALLLGALSKRADFRQHSAGRLSAHDGQQLVIEKKRPVQFVQSLRWIPNQIPNYQPLMTQIDEGYRLSLSSLSSLDNRTIEATIKCNVDQVEKLRAISVQVPGVLSPVALQVPQLVSWRLKERFRWPADQVLLLSCGVVASPEPNIGRPLPRIMGGGKKRADALVFIEYRGPTTEAELPAVVGGRGMVPVNPRR